MRVGEVELQLARVIKDGADAYNLPVGIIFLNGGMKLWQLSARYEEKLEQEIEAISKIPIVLFAIDNERNMPIINHIIQKVKEKRAGRFPEDSVIIDSQEYMGPVIKNLKELKQNAQNQGSKTDESERAA